ELLDVPSPEPEQEKNASGYAIERVALAGGRTPSAPSSPAQSSGPAVPLEEPPRRRTVVGIVVNVMIAAMLVVGLVVAGTAYVNEGKLSAEAFSIEGLKNTFAPSVDFV